jgi:glycosyltransferase involved in cell wall biosynthesis
VRQRAFLWVEAWLVPPRRDRRCQVLIVGPLPPPFHGVATATAALAATLDESDIAYVLVDTADRRGLTNIGRVDVGNIALAAAHAISFLVALVHHRPPVVLVPISQNTWGLVRDFLFLVPARLTGRRIIVHLHGSDFRRFYGRSSRLMRTVIRWLLSGTARTIVLGDSLRPIFSGLVPDERIIVIPNGVDPAPFAAPPPSVADRPADALCVVYLASLMKAKGLLDVIAAAPLVINALPNTHFILAGGVVDPADIDEAEQLLAGLPSATRAHIELPGVLTGTHKAQTLLSADAFVFPPREPEGQPLVILEAMAAGLPVITTDRGAIREVVLDGITGFLVPPRDSGAIAERIVQLGKDRTLRQQMAEASRQRFHAKYRLDRWAADMVQLLSEVARDANGWPGSDVHIQRRADVVPTQMRTDDSSSRPKVSVAMAVHNGGEYLTEAIDSILTQTYAEWELIVIDDGSTDQTASRLDPYAERDTRIRVTHQSNTGLATALQRAVAQCQGEYIARLDADDAMLPERLERQVRFLDDHPEIGLLGTAAELMDERSQPYCTYVWPTTDAELRHLLQRDNAFFHSAVMLRSTVLREVGSYDARYGGAEDYELWLRMAQRCRLASLPDALIRYRTHARNISRVQHRASARAAFGVQIKAVLRGWHPVWALVFSARPIAHALAPYPVLDYVFRRRARRNRGVVVRAAN